MVTAKESNDQKEQIVVAWWNTSLAPSGKSRDCEELRLHAAQVITYLFLTAKVDFLALGETSEEDLAYLESTPLLVGLKFLSGVSKAGRSSFDICYIFNPSKFILLDSENITSVRGGSTLKIGQRLVLIDDKSKTVFNIFSSHWPSRLWCQENHADRHLLGIRLRDEVDKILENSKSPPHIILLGDYNDEPFDKSLSHQLMATRDIGMVQRKKHLLYNPYWSHLGQGNGEKSLGGGSYFYKGGDTTQWHTFDQIIYSHAFINAGQWKLSEENIHISNVPGLLELITSAASKFDHIPVYGIIEKVA